MELFGKYLAIDQQDSLTEIIYESNYPIFGLLTVDTTLRTVDSDTIRADATY